MRTKVAETAAVDEVAQGVEKLKKDNTAEVKESRNCVKAFGVTEDFEAAANRCKAKVKSIAALCRSQNRRFRDIEFDLDFDRDETLHSVDRYASCTSRTAVESSKSSKNRSSLRMVKDLPVKYWDGAQRMTETFLERWERLLLVGCYRRFASLDETVGVYGFIFCVNDGWKEIIIDDLLFTCIPRWEELDRRQQLVWQDNPDKYWSQARKGGRSLNFARSMNENETWVALLEKAYAKLCGDYSSMYRRIAVQIVEHLTGSLYNSIALRDIIDPDELWKKKLLPIGQDHLATVYIDVAPAGSANYKSEKGLVDDEPFYVTKAIEIAGKRFLLMRNPWGHKSNEWTGRWGTGSPEWTPEWLQRVITGEFAPFQFGQEGMFIMEYCDFLETWDFLASFQIFDSSWALAQLWLDVDLGGYPKAHDYGDVSYTIHIDEPTRMIISLQSQYFNETTEGLASPFLHKLDFVLFRRGESEPLYFSQKSDFATHYGVAVDIDLLEAGDYVLHPRIDRERRTLKPPPSLDPAATAPRPGTPTPADGNAPKAPKPPVVGRKFTHVKSSMLLSRSVAANFDVTHGEFFARHMPLPPGTFIGEDLTTMEFRIFDRLLKEKAEKKAAWDLSNSRLRKSGEGEGLVTGEGEGAKTGESGGRNEVTLSEADASSGSTIVNPTPGIGHGEDGDEDDVFEDALEILEVQANGMENTTSISPTSSHPDHKSNGHRSKGGEDSLPAILLPDFQIPTPPSSSTSSTPKRERNRSRHRTRRPRSPCSRSRSRPRYARSRNRTHRLPPPGSIPYHDPSMGYYGQGPPPMPPPPDLPVHGSLRCSGCEGPIVGIRYTCMESITCPLYNLCEKCYPRRAHAGGRHRFLKVPTLAESTLVFCHDDLQPENQVVLGLKVYTNKKAGTKIEGQLRHGDIIRIGLRRNLVV